MDDVQKKETRIWRNCGKGSNGIISLWDLHKGGKLKNKNLEPEWLDARLL